MTREELYDYALTHYRNDQCVSADEFKEDLRRIEWVKRMIFKYIKYGDLKERTILNHLIIFFNVFEIDPALEILLDGINDDYAPVLKAFLDFLHYLPEGYMMGVIQDEYVTNKLREI